jgi:hypothetical protein
MKLLWLSVAVVVLGALGTVTAGTTHAAIHEIVAAYCSGGGHGVIGDDGFLEPPGVTDPTKSNFAKPPGASGAVVVLDPPPAPIVIEVTDKPNAKITPGVYVVTAGELGIEDVDHPSAEHCPKFPG